MKKKILSSKISKKNEINKKIIKHYIKFLKCDLYVKKYPVSYINPNFYIHKKLFISLDKTKCFQNNFLM